MTDKFPQEKTIDLFAVPEKRLLFSNSVFKIPVYFVTSILTVLLLILIYSYYIIYTHFFSLQTSLKDRRNVIDFHEITGDFLDFGADLCGKLLFLVHG